MDVSIRPIGVLCQDNERQWQPHHPKNFWKMKLSAVFWVKYFEYLKCALGDVSGFVNYAGVANLGEGDFESCILTISIWIIHDGRQHLRKILMDFLSMAWLSLRLIKLWSCGSDCPRDHSIWSVVSQKGNIFPLLVSPEGIPSSTNSCQMSATRLAIIPQYSTGFNFIGNTFFLKICGIFIQPDGKHITLKMGTWITAFANSKGLQGWRAIWQNPRMWWTLQCVQYDGCSLQSYSSYPSALCGARTQTHSSTHIVLHTHSYKHLYTVSQYNTYQHKHTETQTRAKTHVNRQRHRERHMDTNWLSQNSVVCSLCSPLS